MFFILLAPLRFFIYITKNILMLTLTCILYLSQLVFFSLVFYVFILVFLFFSDKIRL